MTWEDHLTAAAFAAIRKLALLALEGHAAAALGDDIQPRLADGLESMGLVSFTHKLCDGGKVVTFVQLTEAGAMCACGLGEPGAKALGAAGPEPVFVPPSLAGLPVATAAAVVEQAEQLHRGAMERWRRAREAVARPGVRRSVSGEPATPPRLTAEQRAALAQILGFELPKPESTNQLTIWELGA